MNLASVQYPCFLIKNLKHLAWEKQFCRKPRYICVQLCFNKSIIVYELCIGMSRYILKLPCLRPERRKTYGGFIKGMLRGVRCTKSLRVLFLHRRPPSWTTLVLYSRAVFIFNEPAYRELARGMTWPSQLECTPYFRWRGRIWVCHCCCVLTRCLCKET